VAAAAGQRQRQRQRQRFGWTLLPSETSGMLRNALSVWIPLSCVDAWEVTTAFKSSTMDARLEFLGCICLLEH
jgi:hypothetical protein